MVTLIRSYLILTIITTLVAELVPDGKMKEYIKCFAAIVLSMGILSGIADVFGKEWDVAGYFESVYTDGAEYGEEWIEDEAKRIYGEIIGDVTGDEEE